MSFAFGVDAAPTGGLRAIHAATVAIAGGGFALSAFLAPLPWGVALVAVGAPACLAAWRLGGRRLSWGCLSVDASGRASWRATGDGGPAGERAVRIERWCATEGLVWLRLREAAGGRRHDVLLARRVGDDDRWRRLRTWLVWLGRGPDPATDPRSP